MRGRFLLNLKPKKEVRVELGPVAILLQYVSYQGRLEIEKSRGAKSGGARGVEGLTKITVLSKVQCCSG